MFSIWWFMMVLFVTGIVILVVSIFYSGSVDVRHVEAEVLYERLMECVVEQGFLILEFFNPDFDIFEKCNLNKNIFQEETILYFNVSFFNSEGVLVKNITSAATQLEGDCRAVSLANIDAEKYAYCNLDKESILYYSVLPGQEIQIKNGKVEILTASNIVGGKIKK